MEYTEAKKLPGILLFIDFCKAFEAIEWNFIHKCIELYNFGQVLQNGYPFFMTMLKVGVMNAGFMTNYFKSL